MNALDFFIELAIAAAHVEPCIECGDWVAYWMPSEAYYHVGSEARPCWFHYSWEADMPTTLTTTTTNHLSKTTLGAQDRVTFLPTVCGTSGAVIETTADVHPAALIQGF
jgi:hypothetical protein